MKGLWREAPDCVPTVTSYIFFFCSIIFFFNLVYLFFNRLDRNLINIETNIIHPYINNNKGVYNYGDGLRS